MASLASKKVNFVAGAQRSRVAGRRSVQVCAKYGEAGKYVDLKDMENTTASWDLYGVDEPKRYPALQETFFKRATDVVSRREALNAFVALAGLGGAVAYGFKGAADAGLPITKGPREGKTENGKGGSVRGRI